VQSYTPCIYYRGVKIATRNVKRMGRPPTGQPTKRPVSVMLDVRVAEALRAYGDGNLSVGVALVASKARRAGGAKRPRPLPEVRVCASAAPVTSDDAENRGVGRPLFGSQPRKRTNVQMYPALVEEMRIFGDGNVSRGIERAAIIARAVKL
jgi:hypothetical protein